MIAPSMSWPEAVFLSISTVIVFAIAIVAIWQAFKTWQAKVAARIAIAQDEAYRALAEQATVTQQALTEEQRRLAVEVAGVGERLSEIEKLLREVG